MRHAKKLLCPAELDNLDAYYEAISDGEAVCDDFSTSEKVLADCVENIKEAKANLSGDFEDSVIRQVDFNNISKDSTFKKAVDNTTTYTSAGTDLDNVHFHAINSNLTFLKNLYDNDTYFCTFISNIVNEKNGYIYFEPRYVYTYPDGSQDQHEFTFEDGDCESFIYYIDVMFNCDIEEYDYIEIDSGNDNSFLI
ncbi:MAG: hypothetical protein LIO44_07230 [Eubacterium sp.]|nr:hypothetical protein [Eubacterium sp.]